MVTLFKLCFLIRSRGSIKFALCISHTEPSLTCVSSNLFFSFYSLVHIYSFQVDGLGVTGVEGLFRRCCESTMRSLRRPDNAAALTTLAEVSDALRTPLHILNLVLF